MTENERMVLDQIAQGIFQIDADGRLWRHFYRVGAYGKFKLKPCDPPYLCAQVDPEGYLYVASALNRKRFAARINRVVYLFTHGTIDDGLPVDHIDFDRSNNRPDNLQQVTTAVNNRRSIEAGRCVKTPIQKVRHRSGLIRVAQARARYTDEQIRDIRRRTGSQSQVSLAREFGCSNVLISRIQHHQTYFWVKDELSA